MCLDPGISRAVVIGIAYLIYKVCACFWDTGSLFAWKLSQQEAVKRRTFLEELNVRDETKGKELNLLFQ